MEKLRPYIAPPFGQRSEYVEVSQSAADEREVYCPHCDHGQSETPPALRASITQTWLALRTIATLLFGLIIVFILLLAKQYMFDCSSSCSSSHGLLSDQAFSDIPLRRVVWKEERGFVESDPFDGHRWGNFGDEGDESKWTPWDDIYDGSWVSIEPDETLGIPSGVPIKNFSMDAGRPWETTKHGYSPSINHQIHCLGLMKHWLMPSGHDDIDYTHAGHCVEYIRHAIMCAGDLTLEPPENPTRTHLEAVAYDETVHLCRDWTALSAALRQKSLGFEVDDDRGLVPFDNSHWHPQQPVVPFQAVQIE